MSTVHPAKYLVLEMMDLPEEVQTEVDCPGNDVGMIINPEYHPLIRAWLSGHGYSNTDCYIGWWSW